MTLLFVTIPQAYIFIIVIEVEGSLAVLMVLQPLTLVLLTIVERIDAKTLTLTLDIFTFKAIAIFPCRLAFSMWFSCHHLSLILTAIFHLTGAKGYLLG